jgi:hypothetical protein
LALNAARQALEEAGQRLLNSAAAKGTLLSGGTAHQLVNALLERLEETATRLIAAQVRAGVSAPAQVAGEVRDELNPLTEAFLASHAKRGGAVFGPAFEALRPKIGQFFASLEDRALIALAENPTATEQIIADVAPGPLPDGWDRVNRGLQKARTGLSRAGTAEDFQAVGLLCRETLISTAQSVYDPHRHPPLDGSLASDTDAKRQLASYFAVELAGGSNESARRHAASALDLANTLQHDRTPNVRLASLCVAATSAVVTIVEIIAGMNDAS